MLKSKSIIDDIKKRSVTLSCCAIVGCLAMWLTWWQMERTQLLHESRVSLEAYAAGTVHRPFCYRVLVPMLMRLMSPAFVGIEEIGEQVPVELPHRFAFTNSTVTPLYISVAIILFVSLCAYAVVVGRIYRQFVSESPYAAHIGSIASLLFLIPFVTRGIGHIYDFSVLFFNAMLLLCIALGNAPLYLLVFAFSCINKETTLFMMFAFAACFYDRIPWRQFAFWMIIQIGLFVLIHGTIRTIYRENPGAGMEFWLFEQLSQLPHCWKRGVLLPLAIAGLVSLKWSVAPVVLRRASVMLIPHLGFYFCGGSPGEIRALYESVPLLTLLSIHSIEQMATSFRRYPRPAIAEPISGIR